MIMVGQSWMGINLGCYLTIGVYISCISLEQLQLEPQMQWLELSNLGGIGRGERYEEIGKREPPFFLTGVSGASLTQVFFLLASLLLFGCFFQLLRFFQAINALKCYLNLNYESLTTTNHNNGPITSSFFSLFSNYKLSGQQHWYFSNTSYKSRSNSVNLIYKN